MTRTDLQRTAVKVIQVLRDLQIPFHVSGGLASSFYGEPRLTQDIDLVVRLDERAGHALCEALQGDFLVEKDAAQEAIRRQSMFQVLDRSTFIKVDFHVGERIEGELSRSVLQPLFENCSAPVVSKEDAIASKLLWIKEGSEKSKKDVIGMLLDPGPLDILQARKTAGALGCGEILEQMEREARERLAGEG